MTNKTQTTKIALLIVLFLAGCNEDHGSPIVPKPSSELPADLGTVNCKEIYSLFRRSDGAWMHATPEFVCVPERDKDGNLVWRKT